MKKHVLLLSLATISALYGADGIFELEKIKQIDYHRKIRIS